MEYQNYLKIKKKELMIKMMKLKKVFLNFSFLKIKKKFQIQK